MKSLIKIYGKYIGVTWLIVLLLFMANMMFLMWLGLERVAGARNIQFRDLSNLENIIFEEGADQPVIGEEGERYLAEKGYEFLFVLNDGGDVLTSWNQPEGFPDHYTAGEIAAFSRWYLYDYPVKVWRSDKGLLVAGGKKGSVWKHGMEYSMDFINHLGSYIRIFISINLLIILLTVFFLGYRYYQSLLPLSKGILALSANRKIHLTEKGVTSELARQINKTSDVLEQQRKALEKRDEARTEWIAGVSHDIRTPLSMIMGYADELEQSEHLEKEERNKAAVIKGQSLKIRQLIEDLNLTSKLEYHMQPLRICPFYPAALLRKLAAEMINEGLPEQYELNLTIQREMEAVRAEGDEELIARAVRNLMNNSIRHNPGGCRIFVEGRVEKDFYLIQTEDNGPGIPENIIRGLLEEKQGTDKKPHIMGLRIVKQIVLAHKGGFEITKRGCCVKLWFPIDYHVPFQDRKHREI